MVSGRLVLLRLRHHWGVLRMSDYVVTARVGHNDEQFPDLLRLYVKPGSVIADVTWGRGIFWRQVDVSQYTLHGSDLRAESVDVRACFTALPYAADVLDVLVLDPPYLYTGGFKTLRNYFHDDTQRWGGSTYGNKERATEQGIRGVAAVDELYFRGMDEARRVVRHKGIVIVKCMDQVMSGKQVWAHITYLNYGESIGLRSEDLFVTVRKTQPLMRHKAEAQKHARRNHSYFLVFRNWKPA